MLTSDQDDDELDTLVDGLGVWQPDRTPTEVPTHQRLYVTTTVQQTVVAEGAVTDDDTVTITLTDGPIDSDFVDDQLLEAADEVETARAADMDQSGGEIAPQASDVSALNDQLSDEEANPAGNRNDSEGHESLTEGVLNEADDAQQVITGDDDELAEAVQDMDVMRTAETLEHQPSLPSEEIEGESSNFQLQLSASTDSAASSLQQEPTGTDAESSQVMTIEGDVPPEVALSVEVETEQPSTSQAATTSQGDVQSEIVAPESFDDVTTMVFAEEKPNEPPKIRVIRESLKGLTRDQATAVLSAAMEEVMSEADSVDASSAVSPPVNMALAAAEPPSEGETSSEYLTPPTSPMNTPERSRSPLYRLQFQDFHRRPIGTRFMTPTLRQPPVAHVAPTRFQAPPEGQVFDASLPGRSVTRRRRDPCPKVRRLAPSCEQQ